MKLRNTFLLSLMAIMSLTTIQSQEDDPILPYKVAPQNLLKFNRFLINPTFSTVQEDNSYINILHRNQSVSFKNNNQTYFLSYSGRMGDKTGLGLSLYTQKVGAVSNVGVLANYAYGIKLSDKSNFTFGTNIAYYNTGLNRNDLDPVNQVDNALTGTEDSNVFSFQPGFNLSYGSFDFGVFAENLFDYNMKTSKMLTDFKDKTYAAHLQYTYRFKKESGLLESARLMPLMRARMNAQNGGVGETNAVTLGGSLILDLPKLGWIQGGYDSFYGASAGAGFNLSKRLSIGYTMEKGFGTELNNLGITHEISFAYSFTPNLTDDRVMLELPEDEEVAQNQPEKEAKPATSDELAALKKKLAENEEVLAELMFRQDSLEANRQKDLERRFEMVMRMVRNETNGNRPDLEKRAKELFLNDQNTQTASTSSSSNYTNSATQDNAATKTSNLVARNNIAQDKTKASYDKSDTGLEDIRSKKFKNLEGVSEGYYIVANIYKGEKYMQKFMNLLNNKGFASNYIENPDTGLKYVYLERYDTWDAAAEAYKTNLGGDYTGPMWIMNIDNRYTNKTYEKNVDKLTEKSTKYAVNSAQKNAIPRDRVPATVPNPKAYNLDGVAQGFYIIANVFANPNNAKKFVKLLNSYGLNASYFINPKNNWRYVYLKKHESWSNALISYYSKLNNAYDDKMWIMRVKSNLLS